MANDFHKNLTDDENHALTAATYADIAARDADVTFNTDVVNLNKMVRVDSPLAYYVLFAITPTFIELTNTGADSFIEHVDTPSSYVGNVGQILQVNALETALEYGQALRTSDNPIFGQLNVDNLRLDGNALSSLDVNGNIELTPNGTGAVLITSALTVSGNLNVQGVTTFLDTQTLQIEDKNIELGKVAVPTDLTADGGGITLLGTTNKTILWDNTFNVWAFNQAIDMNGNDLINVGFLTMTDLLVGSLRLSGKTLSSIDTDSDILIVPDGAGRVGIRTATPAADLEVVGETPGNVGGFASGMTQLRGEGTSLFSNCVLTGHNSFNGNTQLWYLGSSSSSSDDITLINRQNGSLSFATNNTTRLTITASGTLAASGDLDVTTSTGGAFKFSSQAFRAGLDAVEYVEIGHGGGNGFINAVGDGGLDIRFEGATLATFTDFGHLHLQTNVDQKHTLKIITANNANDTGLAWENSGGSFTGTVFRTDVGSNRADLVFAVGLNIDIDLLTEALRIHGSVAELGKFEVVGDLQISSGSPALDSVLTSDASGNATWQAASTSFAQLSDSTAQKPAATTPTVVTFDTNDGIRGITHSVSVAPEDIVIDSDGTYTLIAHAQVEKTSGGGTVSFHLWTRIGLDDKGGVSAVSIANPSQIGTDAAHGLTSGQTVELSGLGTTPDINGQHIVTVISASLFTIPVNVTAVADGVGIWRRILDINDDQPNSNVELNLTGAVDSSIIPLIVTRDFTAGEKLNVMQSISATGLGVGLVAKSPAGEAVIPSITFTINRS